MYFRMYFFLWCLVPSLLGAVPAFAGTDAALSALIAPEALGPQDYGVAPSVPEPPPAFTLTTGYLKQIDAQGSVVADRLRDEFKQCARRAGLDLSSFNEITWRALTFSFEILLENILQHEYSNEPGIRARYRIYARNKKVIVEFLGRGDSEKFYSYIIPGKRYSASDRPWTTEIAPARARGNTGAGRGLSYLFRRFARIESYYWNDLLPGKKREITVSWDYNTTGVTVPGARNGGHLIRLTVPLMKKSTPAKQLKPYPQARKQYVKMIRRYLHDEQALITATVAERIASLSDDDAARVEDGNISLDYAYVLSRVLCSVMRLPYHDLKKTSFVPQAVTHEASGKTHCVVVFYFKGKPRLIIDPCYYKFDSSRRGNIIVSGYDLPALGYTNALADNSLESKKAQWAKELFKETSDVAENNKKYFFTWRSIIKEIVTQSHGLFTKEDVPLRAA